MCKCQRCGRELKSQESRDRVIDGKKGWGKVCYRITELEKVGMEEVDELAELKTKWSQLSLKYSVLERKLNKLISSGIQTSDPIERIKRTDKIVSTEEGKLKVLIHQELRDIFTDKDGNFDPKWKVKILHSADEIEEVREPPK